MFRRKSILTVYAPPGYLLCRPGTTPQPRWGGGSRTCCRGGTAWTQKAKTRRNPESRVRTKRNALATECSFDRLPSSINEQRYAARRPLRRLSAVLCRCGHLIFNSQRTNHFVLSSRQPSGTQEKDFLTLSLARGINLRLYSPRDSANIHP